VLSQSPSAGHIAARRRKVNLTVAKAPKEVAVPNVVGATEAAAAAALEKAGFTVKTVRTAHDKRTGQVGRGPRTEPAAGAQARARAPR
jgi:beta-lactam-binding protein with PASTA domain